MTMSILKGLQGVFILESPLIKKG